MEEPHIHQRLWEVSKEGDVAVIGSLLEAGADPNKYRDGKGYSALIRAASKGHRAAALQLVSHQANVSEVTNTGWTALHWAAFNGDTPMVLSLMLWGANPQHKASNDGKTPAEVAKMHDHVDIVRLGVTTHIISSLICHTFNSGSWKVMSM